MRRTLRLPADPDAGGPPLHPGSGPAGDAPVPRPRRPGGRPRGRDRALGRGAAPRGRHRAEPGPLHCHPVHRPGQPHRPGPTRGAQPGHLRGGGQARPLLCPGPVVPDRLHHRRQCRGELRRGALPQVRAHGTQRPGHYPGHGGG